MGYHLTKAPRAENQELIGEQLYFFRSLSAPPNITQALVMAHGSWTENSAKFNVPAGTTVHFYIPHGATAANPSVQTHIIKDHHSAVEDIGAGQECYNYSLAKVLGHGADVGAEKPRWYNLKVQQYMEQFNTPNLGKGEWAPNVVTVRHRAFHSGSVTLDSLISQVKTHCPTITDFYVLACRAIFSEDGKLQPHEAVKV